MRLSPLAIGPVLAGCALIAMTSCSTDERETEAGLAPTMTPAVAAVSAYDIVKVPSMTIDGNLTDWANIPVISMADNSGRGGGMDNTAKVRLAWDDTYLYAAYDVTDTELLAVQTTRDHPDIYQDDEAELYIDPQGDGAGAPKMTATDYHFLANVRDALGENKGTTPPGAQDASFNPASFLAKAVTNGTLNAAGTDVGYTIEMRIAWTDLGVTPTAGHFMRIDPAVGDRDGNPPPPNTAEFDWAGLSEFNNPGGWKDVKLVTPAPPVSAYDVVRVSSMAVDGNLSDWSGIPAISMADNSGRAAGLDNTANVKLAWDDTYLYAAYDVTDSELKAVQTTHDHIDIYQDDEIELYIDPQGDGWTASKMNAADYHFLVNVRNAWGENKGTTPPGAQDASYNPPSFLSSAVPNGTLNGGGADVGYTVELRVSWSDLGVTPAEGSFIRIDPAVGDDDSQNTTTEEFDWAGLSLFNNPSAWKYAKLSGTQPPPPQGSGIPFGLWGLKPDSIPSGTIWTGGVLSNKSPTGVLAQLEAAQNKSPHIGMWFVMAGGSQAGYTNPDGSFNLENWKDSLDRGHGGTIQPDGTSSYYPQYLPYIQDGTFQGIVLLDDLNHFTPYPSFAQVEAMAAHAKLRFPALPTAVRERATELERRHGGAVYTKLDAAWAQYRSDRGSSPSFRDQNIAAAKRLKLGLVLGINITDGLRDGDPTGSYVPPDSLLIWGNEFLKAGPAYSDYACGFYMWSVADYPYLNHPNMTTLANKAKTHVAASCKRR